MYQTIVFDFDGTMIPSLDYWLASYKYAFSQLGKNVPESVIIDRCFYRDVEMIAEFDLESPEEFWRLVEKQLDVEYMTPVLFPGVQAVLEHCTAQNIAVGLVTSGHKAFVERALNTLQIRHHLKAVITADDITNFKPHPEPVLKALSALKAEAQSTLFVGDYIVDVLAGKAAGTHTALYFTEDHSRFHKYDHLQSSEPNFIFSDYNDLLARLVSRSKAG